MNLRAALRLISNQLGQTGQLYSHIDVIRELRKKYPELVTANSRRLEDVALKRLLADVDAKQVRNFDSTQGELFSELVGIPASFDARKFGLSNEKGARILSRNLSVRHLRFLIAAPEMPQRESSYKKRLKLLLEKIEGHFSSEDEIITKVLEKSRKS